MKFKAILFDFFDVIRQDAFHAWMGIHGYTRDDAPGEVSQRMDKGEISLDEFYDELANISGQNVKEVKAEFADNEEFNEAVIELIESLKGKYILALVSNSDAEFLKKLLAKHDLNRLFDKVFISGEMGIAKPSHKFFDYVLNKLQLSAEEVLFIDDQQKNIVAASERGIKGIQFQSADQLKREMDGIL